ncbi:MAG: carboxypeptidase regulatory-like domain-containing protein [Bacteroidetes bacterium]|nr:carboxypeptidase regulatory-like domain-containing protein [Bacteroidota bacterium]
MKEYPIEVKKSNNGSAQDLGSLKVYRSMHRIAFTVREKSNNKPVKGVTIKIKQSNVPPFITGVDGKVQFSSMNENFSLGIPPDEKDLLPVFTIVANTNSSTPKVIPDIFLEPCARISGTVTFGNDHKPLPEADVFLDQGSGGTTSLVKTDSNGKYSLGKIPLSPAEAVITAGKSEPGITIIAKKPKQWISPKTKIVVDFYLPVFDKMSISEIYGLPVIEILYLMKEPRLPFRENLYRFRTMIISR